MHENISRTLEAFDATITELSTVPHDSVLQAFAPLILSASGWRKIFAADQDEESLNEKISSPDVLLTACMAKTFGQFVSATCDNSTLAIGMDTRPTGLNIANVFLAILDSMGITVDFFNSIAVPEFLSYIKESKAYNGFIYISASHNPPGHNGIKLGSSEGAVYGGEISSQLISSFKMNITNRSCIENLIAMLESFSSSRLHDFHKASLKNKSNAFRNYIDFTYTVACNSQDKDDHAVFKNELYQSFSEKSFGILADYNGSARCLSIDEEFLTGLGVKFLSLNTVPGVFSHRIVPEGSSLNECKAALLSAYKQDCAYQLAYVPDCDGDRGNLVVIDEIQERARILEAQEVFALCVLSELSFLHYSNQFIPKKTAVVVNGPTSLRVEEISQKLGAVVFRSEVGEANVINLARSLQSKGYLVRILGEGSNGGNITFPATVRDPLNTVVSLLKLLQIRDTEERLGLYHIWCNAAQRHYSKAFTLTDILSSLPSYTTTSAYEDRAIMKIQSTDHAKLKAAYEAIFFEQWLEKKNQLKATWGIQSYTIFNYEGIHCIEGSGSQSRTGQEKGGFKIQFYDNSHNAIAYLWMRGSGTEAVFRVLAEVKGNNPDFEEFLLNWHKGMILSADRL